MESLAPAPGPDEFVLGYLGTYYPSTQDLSAAMTAIARLAAAGGPAVDRLRFIGPLHPALRAQIDDLGIGGIVEETGFVGHADAIRLLCGSSALLLAGPADAGGILRGHVVGKIPEYLASGRPIVYVGDRDCDAARLVGAHPGCHVVATGDVDGVVRSLAACRDERGQARDTSALSRRALTGRLAGVLDAAASPPRRR